MSRAGLPVGGCDVHAILFVARLGAAGAGPIAGTGSCRPSPTATNLSILGRDLVANCTLRQSPSRITLFFLLTNGCRPIKTYITCARALIAAVRGKDFRNSPTPRKGAQRSPSHRTTRRITRWRWRLARPLTFPPTVARPGAWLAFRAFTIPMGPRLTPTRLRSAMRSISTWATAARSGGRSRWNCGPRATAGRVGSARTRVWR